MSGQITTNNGGEAPSAAKGGSGGATATAGLQTDLMHQHGGQAPVTTPVSGVPQASTDGSAGGGTPPAGGFVRAR